MIEGRGNFKSSYAWFIHIQNEAILNDRKVKRLGEHNIDNRNSIKDLSHKQIHATLHALEMECREKSPAFGVQLEYYYSLYIFFFISAVLSGTILVVSFFSHWIFTHLSISNLSIPTGAIVFNLLVATFGIMGAIRARKMKEYLRITLFNHDRSFVLSLLSKWFHCKFNENRDENC